MSLIANKTALVHSADGTTYARIEDASDNPLCITEYPDLGEEAPDQVEITTLCDETHKFMDGLKNLPEELAFPCHFTKEMYTALETLKSNQDEDEGDYWGVHFGDEAGADGKVHFKAIISRIVINGAGNGDVRTMTLYLKPKSGFTVA